ncbi:retrovirus-related Pol polyprotein from transposon 17.6 [Trichonephila clavipes]|nr:retrovirus-related Pol polyprotein from transposon 17.6 [Trichonephila clavipes]
MSWEQSFSKEVALINMSSSMQVDDPSRAKLLHNRVGSLGSSVGFIEKFRGKANVVADRLSRPPYTEGVASDVCAITVDMPSRKSSHIPKGQLEDEELKKIIDCFESMDKDENFANYTSRGYLMNQGPFPETPTGKKWIFIVEDTSTKLVELFALAEATAENSAKPLIEEVLLRYGLPRRLITDNRPQFISAVMQLTCDLLEITQDLIPVYHLQANPSERKNRDLKLRLAILVGEEHSAWKFANSILDVKDRVEQKQDCQKENYRRQRRKYYKPGDKVWVTIHPISRNNRSRKFMPKREGPYLILTLRSPVTYEIANPDQAFGTYHVFALKDYQEPETERDTGFVAPLRKRGCPKKEIISWSRDVNGTRGRRKIEVSRLKTLSDDDNIFIPKLLTVLLQICVLLHAEGKLASVKFVEDVILWMQEKLFKYMYLDVNASLSKSLNTNRKRSLNASTSQSPAPKKKQSPEFQKFLVKICKDVCQVLADMTLLGYLNRKSLQFLKFGLKMLDLECGGMLFLPASKLLFNHVTYGVYLLLEEKEISVLKILPDCFNKFIQCLNEDIFLKSVPSSVSMVIFF